jgi:hypothetical protein
MYLTLLHRLRCLPFRLFRFRLMKLLLHHLLSLQRLPWNRRDLLLLQRK